MDAKVKEQIDKILERMDKAGTFIQPDTIEEALRDLLAAQKGPAWRECALMSHYLYGMLLYTATLIERVDGRGVATAYVIDCNADGEWYIGATSPVSGYIE